MREAFGGYAAIGIVSLFIIVVSGFLAFTTNYNKAFKMKNRIIMGCSCVILEHRLRNQSQLTLCMIHV